MFDHYTAVLERIRKDREVLAALWGGLTEERMVRHPGPQEDWSVKDLIAHTMWWEDFILQRGSRDLQALPESRD